MGNSSVFLAASRLYRAVWPLTQYAGSGGLERVQIRKRRKRIFVEVRLGNTNHGIDHASAAIFGYRRCRKPGNFAADEMLVTLAHVGLHCFDPAELPLSVGHLLWREVSDRGDVSFLLAHQKIVDRQIVWRRWQRGT